MVVDVKKFQPAAGKRGVKGSRGVHKNARPGLCLTQGFARLAAEATGRLGATRRATP